MNVSQYARHRRCHRNAILYAAQQGRITLTDGLVDVEVADRDWAAKTIVTNARPEPKPRASAEAIEFLEARTARERINVEREALNVKILEMKYVKLAATLV